MRFLRIKKSKEEKCEACENHMTFVSRRWQRPASEPRLGNTGVIRVQGPRPPGSGSGGCECPGTRVTLCPHGRHRTRGWGSGLVSHAAVVWVSRWGRHAAESRGRGGFPAVESFQQQGGVRGPVLCGASGHHLRVRVGPQPGRSEPRKRAADVPRGAPTPPPAAGAARAQQVPGVGC